MSFFAKIYNQLLPPTKKNQSFASKQSALHHFNELEYTEKVHYVLKTSEIFPYDTETGEKNSQNTAKSTLRPEFTCNYNEFLMADTLKDYQNLPVGFD